jgi:hypothetical protein
LRRVLRVHGRGGWWVLREHIDVGHGHCGCARVRIVGRADLVGGEGVVVEGAVHGSHVPHLHGGGVLLVDGRDGILDGLVGDVLLLATVCGMLRLEGMVLLFHEMAVPEVSLGRFGGSGGFGRVASSWSCFHLYS